MASVCDRLQEQSFPENLNSVVKVLCENDYHLKDIMVHHRKAFAELYLQCKKGVDPFLRFQLQWHQHCSAYLLARSYPLSWINMNETLESSLVTTRTQWLDFCEANGVPVPESNAVMMAVSSAIYELMLERAGDIKNSLSDKAVAVPAEVTDAVEGDDVYLRFGGAALCDMLHLHYKQIKSCADSQRAKLSEEIMILQAINIKDKSKIPQIP